MAFGGWKALLWATIAACSACGPSPKPSAPPQPIQEPSPNPTPDPLPEPEPEIPRPDCAEHPHPRCDHPIDRVLIPMLSQQDLAIEDDAGAVLCRRLSIDLLGRIPTPEELKACMRMPMNSRIDAMMAHPDFEPAQRRLWGRELGFDAPSTVWFQIAHLDDLVGAMVRGDLDYGAFAAQTIVHPAFFVPRSDDGWGAGVFSVFLGRMARRDEMDGMRPLARMFTGRGVCDGQAADTAYQACLEAREMGEDIECALGCPQEAVEGGVIRCFCVPSEFAEPGQWPTFGCIGEGLGERISMDIGVCGFEGAESDLRTLIEVSAGQETQCIGGLGECPDQIYGARTDGTYGLIPADPLPQAETITQTALMEIGAVMIARGDFWEAAVDRELRRLLGWWRSGFKQPDSDLPAIRAALAAHLRQHGSLPDLQRLILTSLLYTAATTPPEGRTDPLPIWALGPVKPLLAEAWIDSAQLAVGAPVGRCDHRFAALPLERSLDIARGSRRADFDDDIANPDQLDALFADPQTRDLVRETLNRYTLAAEALGGCTNAPTPTAANLQASVVQAQTAALLCATGPKVTPPDFDPSDTSDNALEDLAKHLAAGLLSRPDDLDLIELSVQNMKQCINSGACRNGDEAARWLCTQMIDSTLFALY